MAQKTSLTSDTLTDRALQYFWKNGFYASSMENLVTAIGANRHKIYSTFGGKKQLYLACFDQYQNTVVTPAFQVVETTAADLASISAYFEYQITQGEITGLPGPGCFVANSATEIATTDADIMAKVKYHNHRLRTGFHTALQREASKTPGNLQTDTENLANLLVIFTNGLWSMSRVVDDAMILRQSANNFLHLISRAMA